MKLVEIRNFIYRLDEFVRPRNEQERRAGQLTALVIIFIAALLLLATLVYPYFT